MIPRSSIPRPSIGDPRADACRLAAVLESSQDAIIAWSLDWKLTGWNRGAELLFGYSQEEALGLPVRVLWTPEVAPTVEYMVARLCQHEDVARFETKHVRRDGSPVEVSATITAIRDPSGRVIGVSSIMRDITERKVADRLLAEEHGRWQAAFQNAPTGMALIDLDGAWLAVNHAVCRLLGRDQEMLVAADSRALTHPEDAEAAAEQARRALDGEIESYVLQQRYVRSDGTVVWALFSSALVRDLDGAPLYFVAQLQDITADKESEAELRQYADELSRLARRDPLTGLDNHREFHSLLEAEMQRGRRYGGEWSVVLLDIDGFTQTEAADRTLADQTLVRTARAISETCRASDRAARIGGDEFALILPHTGHNQARAAGRRVAAAAHRAGVASVSFGVATWPQDGDTVELLLLRADMHLQATKPEPLPAVIDSRLDAQLARCPTGAIRETVLVAKQFLDMDVAYLAQVDETSQTLAAVAGDADAFGIDDGDVLALDGTYCERMLDGRIANAVPDVREEPELATLPATRQAGVGAYIGVPVRLADGRTYGSLCALSRTPMPDLTDTHVEVLRSFAGLIANHLEHDSRDQAARRATAELTGMDALLSALSARDHYTGEHCEQVVSLASDVARCLGLATDQVHEVGQVALLHDIGKVGIPDSVLQKRGALSDAEWDLMRQHPAIGARILAGIPTLSHLASAVNAEHERFDGQGYPDGLRADAIPLASRITFVCDAYHAMTSDRPYRAALDAAYARRELESGAGAQFDPDVVRALLHVLDGGCPQEAMPASAAHPSRLRDVLTPCLPRVTPEWEPVATDGGSLLGQARGVCRQCGSHVPITVTRAAVGGRCGNCGSYDLGVLLPSVNAPSPTAGRAP